MSLEVDFLLFIELIQEYPHLYDLKNKNYRNNEMKENSWAEIAAVLHISVDDCKRLWKNLRDRFTKEKRNVSSDGQAPETTWIYFDKMLFYSKVTTPRRKFIASQNSSNSSWSSMDILTSPESNIDVDLNEPKVVVDEVEDQNTPSTSRQATPTIIKQETASSRRKCFEEECQEITDVAKEMVEKMLEKKNVNDTFASYVSSRLNEMTAEEAEEKRKKILRILEDL